MTKISGFMIIKNGMSQGYPFVEAILSALPICDEFLISDGYSNDDTWKVLQKLKRAHSNKVKLYRDRWKGKTFKAEVLSEMTNILRKRCSGDYVLYVQANEIIHEKMIQRIRDLPENYPEHEMFAFPFYHILGWEHLVHYDTFRVRLAKNIGDTTATEDGWFGYSWKLMFKNPRKLLTYLISRFPLRQVYLEKPIFRYALFPENFVKKLEGHLKLYSRKESRDIIKKRHRIATELLKNKKSITPRKFWNEFSLRGVMGKGPYPRKYRLLLENEHPSLMKPLFGKWRYKVREELFR